MWDVRGVSVCVDAGDVCECEKSETGFCPGNLPKVVIKSINSQLTHVCRPTSKCTFQPKTSKKVFVRVNRLNMRLVKCFNYKKNKFREKLSTIFSKCSGLFKRQRWLAMNFAGWTRPPLTRVGRTLVRV